MSKSAFIIAIVWGVTFFIYEALECEFTWMLQISFMTVFLTTVVVKMLRYYRESGVQKLEAEHKHAEMLLTEKKAQEEYWYQMRRQDLEKEREHVFEEKLLNKVLEQHTDEKITELLNHYNVLKKQFEELKKECMTKISVNISQDKTQ